jgi:hypothetical protein
MNNIGLGFDFLKTDNEGNKTFMDNMHDFARLADENIYSNIHLFDGRQDELPKYDVILIDDIYTSGCNIDEDCIQALYDNGANRVVFYAIAYTRRG